MSSATSILCNSSNNGSSISENSITSHQEPFIRSPQAGGGGGTMSRYESQKRRDWTTFGQYLKNHKPPLVLSRCSGAHILEFLRYLDQFGKTKVHCNHCPFFGLPQPPAPCPCPLKQAWGSLDALVGRLRAAYEENGGLPAANPFGARAVRLYLREVRDTQAKARGIAYEKKKRKRPLLLQQKQKEQSEQSSQLAMEQLNFDHRHVQYGHDLINGGDFSEADHHQPDGHGEALDIILTSTSSDARRSMIALSVFN